jgi:hypothetical protein
VKSYTFDLYYRTDGAYQNSLVKAAVNVGSHWLDKGELRYAYTEYAPAPVGSMFHVTANLLAAYGMPANGVDLTLSGKQCHLQSASLPLDKLESMGWNLKPYPRKYVPVADPLGLRGKVATAGLSIDVSNVIAQDWFADTRGLVVKGAVDTLDALGISFHLYLDHTMWGWIKGQGWYEAYDYLMGFYITARGWRRITTSKRGVTADEIMLHQADIRGNHILSRDEFDEYDLRYDWIMHGAQNGYPRMHKFIRIGDRFCIPDLDVAADIPTTW